MCKSSRLWSGSVLVLALTGCDDGVAPRPAAVTEPLSAARATATMTLSVSAVSATQIDATWVDNEKNETGWQVERSASGSSGSFALLATIGANAQWYSDAGIGVNPSISYCYRVRAFRQTASRTTYSAYSSVACAPGGSLSVSIATTGADVDPDGYTASLVASTSNGPVAISTRATATSEVVSFGALRAGNYYRVNLTDVASNCRVTSPNPMAITISGATQVSMSVACTAFGPPYPAGFPAAAPVSSSAIRVSWMDSQGATNEDGYRVERSLDEGITWTIVTIVSPDSTSFIDEGRSADTLVCYRITAFNAYGESAALNDPCTAPPAAPTNLTVIALDGGTVELRWTDNSAVEDSYRIYAWTPWGPEWIDLEANTTSYQYSGGLYGDPYAQRYVVVARRDGGESSPSNIVDAPPPPQPSSAWLTSRTTHRRGN